MPGVDFRGATLRTRVRNPFPTGHYTVSEKHNKDVSWRQRVQTGHASGITLATHIHACYQSPEHGIDLGACKTHRESGGALFHFEDDPGLTAGLGKERKEGFAS